MAAQPSPIPSFTLPSNQPLIGIPVAEKGKQVVRYYSEEALVEKTVSPDATETALHLAGAWGERDWKLVENDLDRIRHQSQPTPVFEL